eukprot:403349530
MLGINKEKPTSMNISERLIAATWQQQYFKLILNQTHYILKVVITHQVAGNEPRYSKFYIAPKTLSLRIFNLDGTHNICVYLSDDENATPNISLTQYQMQTLLCQPVYHAAAKICGHSLDFMILVKERENDCNLEIIQDENLRRVTEIEAYCDTHKIKFEL